MSNDQIDAVWKKMVSAEVRAMYFGDLAGSYSCRKQIVIGVSFFASSGAAATVAAQMPHWALGLSIISAVFAAYSMAVSLDSKAMLMTKLQSTWSCLAADYESLWRHWYVDDAEELLNRLIVRAREASELGASDAPNDESRLEKWRQFVHNQYPLLSS
ncbi:MAG: hypothetical protein ABSG13_18555 [Bryobacteraceae bacterium]